MLEWVGKIIDPNMNQYYMVGKRDKENTAFMEIEKTLVFGMLKGIMWLDINIQLKSS